MMTSDVNNLFLMAYFGRLTGHIIVYERSNYNAPPYLFPRKKISQI